MSFPAKCFLAVSFFLSLFFFRAALIFGSCPRWENSQGKHLYFEYNAKTGKKVFSVAQFEC